MSGRPTSRRRGDGRARSQEALRAAVAAALVPTITYPELPVSQRRDEIAAAIRDHQVVIVAGETGSGKTTQLPKICLELGRGVDGHDRAHPAAADRGPHRRRADRRGAGHASSGTRSATQVRFTDRVGDGTLVKVMTDGILLAEIQRDRLLRALRHADHRRGPRAQPEHRLPARLPRAAAAPAARPQGDHHLGDHRPAAVRRGTSTTRPIVEVSGRTYPVEVRYRPLGDRGRRRRATRSQAIVRRRRRAAGARAPGDVLVFLSGEREIRDTADALRRAGPAATPRSLPLYARLSAAEQHRVFQPHTRTPDRAGDQRRRDLADRARHPLRRRPRHGAHLPLQPPPQGAAAADRAGLAGVGQPARRPLRPRRRRHLHPALRRGGLRSPGPSSPSPRSCAPTWPRSSCR